LSIYFLNLETMAIRKPTKKGEEALLLEKSKLARIKLNEKNAEKVLHEEEKQKKKNQKKTLRK